METVEFYNISLCLLYVDVEQIVLLHLGALVCAVLAAWAALGWAELSSAELR